MMLKKVLLSFTFFCLLQFALFSCCKPKLYEREINTIDFSVVDNNDEDLSEIVSEDLILHFDVTYNTTLVSSLFDDSLVPNMVYATTPCEDDYTMNNKVSSIAITANETIFDIEAGHLLNEKLEYYTFETSNPNQNIDGLFNYLNAPLYSPEGVNIVLKEAIEPNVSLFFTIQLILENGQVIEWNSPTINFI